MEKDADGQSVYEAHITKADGTHVTVLLDASYAITGEQAGGPGGHGGKGGKGGNDGGRHGQRGAQPGTQPGTQQGTGGSTTGTASSTNACVLDGTPEVALRVTIHRKPKARMPRNRIGTIGFTVCRSLRVLRLRAAPVGALSSGRHALERQSDRLRHGLALAVQQHTQRCERLDLRLAALDPHRVLERGYAWLSDADGHALTRVGQLSAGQNVQATLADGTVPLVVR